jgi:phosphoribosylanthranilate isomerase
MFTIKICGVTRPTDVAPIAEAGADAIGLNFYPKSRRYLSPDAAKAVRDAAPQGLSVVGVFVNSSPAEIAGLWRRLALDLVQLHGDEPPELLAELGDIPTLRAFRCRREQKPEVLDYVRRCRALGAPLVGALIDACDSPDYGGSGALADWPLAAELVNELDVPVILAGGLTSDNVAEAIAAVHPVAVDVASGVESSPGIKDANKALRFVGAARAAGI